jgi:hypothetical protein
MREQPTGRKGECKGGMKEGVRQFNKTGTKGQVGEDGAQG